MFQPEDQGGSDRARVGRAESAADNGRAMHPERRRRSRARRSRNSPLALAWLTRDLR